jgi:hypothetical protein
MKPRRIDELGRVVHVKHYHDIWGTLAWLTADDCRASASLPPRTNGKANGASPA